MSLSLIEGAVNAVKTYLSTNMAAKLNTLDAEYGDFTLDDISQWYVAELTAIPAYPVALILGDATAMLSEGEGWLRSSHIVTIVCLATDQDAEQLRRRLYRYIRAVVELLKEGRASLGYTVVFERLEFSPLYTHTGGFLSDSRCIVRLGKYES